MDRILHIVRGIPGSGKSTKAKSLAPTDLIFEADNYHIKKGVYQWKPENVKYAHVWCKERVRAAMAANKGPLVVSNTSTTQWELNPYLEFADEYGYTVEIHTPDSPWWNEIYPRIKDKTFTDSDVNEFYKRNIHDVPLASIRKMMERWEECTPTTFPHLTLNS